MLHIIKKFGRNESTFQELIPFERPISKERRNKIVFHMSTISKEKRNRDKIFYRTKICVWVENMLCIFRRVFCVSYWKRDSISVQKKEIIFVCVKSTLFMLRRCYKSTMLKLHRIWRCIAEQKLLKTDTFRLNQVLVVDNILQQEVYRSVWNPPKI
jgi:hypothetical protein